MQPQLTPQEITRLVPLLNGLARLVASGQLVSDQQLSVLLLGARMNQHPAALAEVRGWAHLLQSAVGSAGPAGSSMRQSVIESLILRGLPRIASVEAVATVVTAQAALTVPALVITPDYLELAGAIGQSAIGVLSVLGGPGQVLVPEGAQVWIEPQAFGPSLTRIRVEVPTQTHSPFITTLRLVTASEIRDILVRVQWIAAVGSAPFPLPQSQDVVPAPLSGSLPQSADPAQSQRSSYSSQLATGSSSVPQSLHTMPGSHPVGAGAKRNSRGLQAALLALSILLFLLGTVLGSYEGTIRSGQVVAQRYYFGEGLAQLGSIMQMSGFAVFVTFVGVALLQGRKPPVALIGLGVVIFLIGVFIGLSDWVVVGRESATIIQGIGLGIVAMYFLLMLLRRR